MVLCDPAPLSCSGLLKSCVTPLTAVGGIGGFAQTYLACQVDNGDKYAIKQMKVQVDDKNRNFVAAWEKAVNVTTAREKCCSVHVPMVVYGRRSNCPSTRMWFTVKEARRTALTAKTATSCSSSCVQVVGAGWKEGVWVW